MPYSKLQLDLELAKEASRQGKDEEVLVLCNGVLNEDPNNAEALYMIGAVFLRMERLGLGYSILKRSLELKPMSETWNLLGSACLKMHRLEDSEKYLRRALKADPSNSNALGNLALHAVYEVDADKAIAYGKRSLEIHPKKWQVEQTMGYAYLMKYDFANGWPGYENMVGHSKYRTVIPPHADCPYWDYTNGHNVYVAGEQGIGDEISFASILPDFLRDQKRVVYECHEKLGGLLKRSFPGVEIHATRWTKGGRDRWLEFNDKFDCYTLIGSLATKYRSKAEDFPGTPYLVPDPERRLQWRALLDTLPGKKIGITWTGGTKVAFRERRSFPLETLLPILKTEGVSWVSLQYEDPSAEIEAFEEKHGIKIHHWKRAAESNDYDDQAALVAELDLVISVCTAIIHLSGAIGKECWVMVPNKPRWLYGLSGQTSPWYRSIKMYRQSEKWPVERIAYDLKERLKNVP